MQLSLSNSLGTARRIARGYSFTDSDAEAYVTALETAGATPTDDQKSAIDTFYATGKSEGWYANIKRLYLPIWAAAAPNAIDMIALGSGTWNGGITHASGYAQSNGTTGYFDYGDTTTGIGLTQTDASIFQMMAEMPAPSNTLIGYRGAGLERFTCDVNGTANMRGNIGSNVAGFTIFGTEKPLILCTRSSTTSIDFYSRSGSGFLDEGNDATSDTQALLALNPYAVGGWNNNGTAQVLASNKSAAHGVGTHFTSSEAENFTLALKNLWETTTGLTLS